MASLVGKRPFRDWEHIRYLIRGSSRQATTETEGRASNRRSLWTSPLAVAKQVYISRKLMVTHEVSGDMSWVIFTSVTMVTVRKRSKSTSSIVPDENVWLRDKPATSRLAVVNVYLNTDRIGTPGWNDLLWRPSRVQSCASNDMPLPQEFANNVQMVRQNLFTKPKVLDGSLLLVDIKTNTPASAWIN
jgi:hypothetical protein